MATENEIKELKLEDFEIGQIFDKDGYHLDVELSDFKVCDNSIYEMSVKTLGRSDKLSL